MRKLSFTLLVLFCALQIVNAQYYWNGVIVTGTGITPGGGAGTWATTNNWTTGNPGNATAWPTTGSNTATFIGTSGKVSITATLADGPSSTTFNTTNYTLTPSSSTAVSLPGSIVLGSGSTAINLNLLDNSITTSTGSSARTLTLTGSSITGYTGSTISRVGTNGLSTSNYPDVILAPSGSTYTTSIPFIFNSPGSGYVLLGYSAGTAGTVTLSGGVTIASGNTSTVVIGSTVGYTFNIGGITGSSSSQTSPVIISNHPVGSGAGTVILSGASNYYGPTTLGLSTSGTVQCTVNSALSPNSALTFGTSATSGQGPTLDLAGTSQTIPSIATVNSATGKIENSVNSTTATLTINQPAGTVNTFGLPIVNGPGTNGLTALVLESASGTASSLTLSSTNNTFTGGLTVNAYGNLITGAAQVLAAGLPVTLAGGGTITTSSGSNYNQGTYTSPLGTLTVNSGGGTIALGSANSVYFSNSSAITWGGTLTITGWTGSNHIFFGNSSSGLNTTQLSTTNPQVVFSGGSYNGQYGKILPSGEVVPDLANIATVTSVSPSAGYEALGTQYTVTVTATAIPANNSTATYAISNIMSSQVVGGSLTGTVTFDGVHNTATQTFTVQNDNTFEATETGSVALTSASGVSVNGAAVTFTLYDDGNFYWNGGTPASGSTVTPAGGTGTWDVTNSWVSIIPGNTTGTGTTWEDGYAAYIANGTGTISLNGTTTPTLNPTSINVTTNNNVITPNSSTTVTLSGNIVLGTGSTPVNLGLNDPSAATSGTVAGDLRTLVLTGNITGVATGTAVAGVTGSVITIGGQQGNNIAVYSEVALQPSAISGVYSTNIPFIMNGTGGGYVALDYNGGYSGASLNQASGSYTLNGNGVTGQGAVQIASTNNAGVVLGGSTGYTLTVNGITAPSNNTSPVWITNHPGGSGKGTFIFEGTSNYYGVTYLASNTNGIVQCSGSNSLSPNSVITFGSPTTSGQGPDLDLNGTTQTIAGLTNTTGGTGEVENVGTGLTGVLNISQGHNVTNTFGLPIINGGSGSTTALTLTGADNTSSLTLTSTGNTFTGGLTINQYGNFITGAANVLASALPVTLNGGTFATGSTTGFANTVGALTVSGTTNTIAFAPTTTGYTLTFASATGISASTPLTITGWNGTAGTSGTAASTSGKLIVTGTVSQSDLDNINFTGFGPGAKQVSGNEIVPAQALLTATLAAVSPSTGSETAGTTYTITVNTTLSSVVTNVANASTVNYTITGIQASQLASGSLTGTITIPAGSSTGTTSITVHNDGIFEGTETGTVAISTPTADIGYASVTTQTFQLVDAGAFYWNGTAGVSTSVGPAGGGTGTWNANYAWIAPSDDANGVAATWQPGGYNAYLGHTAGVVTLASSPNPTNTYIQTTGYTLTTSTSPNNTEILGGTVNLPAGYNLNIFTPTTTTTKELDINGLSSGTGSTLTINQGAAATIKTDQLDFDLANSTIAANINIVSAVTQSGGGAGSVVGIVGNAAGITVSGNITNTSSAYAYTLLGITGSSNTMTISGAINSTAPINFANGTTGGAGTLLLTNTNNSFTTAYFNGSANGSVKAGPAGSIPTTALFVMGATSGSGQNFDLNGNDVTIASLSSFSGGTGVITNTAASGTNTLTIDQAANTSFGLIIQDGATATTAITKSGTGTLSISGLNTFTGGLTLSGGIFQMGTSGNLLANTLPVTFSGGTFSTGATSGYNETVGALNLTSSSTIAFGTGGHTLTFSSIGTFASGQTLAVTGWSGTQGSGGTANSSSGKLIVVGTLTTGQLAAFRFSGYPDGAYQNSSTHEVVPPSGYAWTGATSTVWSVATNWNPGLPPNLCTSNITIPKLTGSSPNYPTVGSGSPVSIGNLTVNDGATLTLNATLSTCGTVTGGSLTAGTIAGTSAIILSGSTAQTVSGLLNVNNLEVDNAAGATADATANLNVNTVLQLEKGNFTNNSGGTVTLVSTATQDAYLDDWTSTTPGTFSGKLSVQRYLLSNTNIGYRDLSSPVSTTVANLGSSIAISGQNGVECWYNYSPYPNLQVYDEQHSSIVSGAYYERWISYTGSSNTLSPMLGVAARLDNLGELDASGIVTLTGTPYTGSQSVTVTSSTSGNGQGWNFVGNPYPSPILWSNVKAMNSNITNSSYYVFHTTAQYGGNWGAHNGTTGVNNANNEIASSQGFFVQSATASNTFVMNNTVRTPFTTGNGYYSALHLLDNEVRLVLSNASDNDEIVTYTDANATNGYDPSFDAVKMPAGSTVNMAYTLGGYDYAINVMNSLDELTVLPLTILVTDSGSYTLAATTLNVNGLSAYLADAINNTVVDLSSAPVQLVLNGGQTYSGRYSVIFKRNEVSGITNVDGGVTSIYSYNGTVTVERPASDAATIIVTNVLGQQIAEFSTQSNKTEFDLPAATPWYAIVKVTEGKKVTVSKVLIAR